MASRCPSSSAAPIGTTRPSLRLSSTGSWSHGRMAKPPNTSAPIKPTTARPRWPSSPPTATSHTSVRAGKRPSRRRPFPATKPVGGWSRRATPGSTASGSSSFASRRPTPATSHSFTLPALLSAGAKSHLFTDKSLARVLHLIERLADQEPTASSRLFHMWVREFPPRGFHERHACACC